MRTPSAAGWLAPAIGVLALLLTVSGAAAQGVRGAGQGSGEGQGAGRGGAAAAPAVTLRNLQVLPKDLPPQQIGPIMQGFANALGTNCRHCHVFEGPNHPANDFASDAKPEKQKARTMMRMVRDVNARLGSELGKPASEVAQVRCVTCHRGNTSPKG